jgi:protein TonB
MIFLRERALMSTIAKENESQTIAPDASAPRPASVSRAEESGGRPQPVALEVPVSVNGARTIEGSDKREPFSESTKTVLIFGNGAVIRLASAVAPGQLLFLTNDKTRKEVVCQVVKSKNYRNVSGYVELEFTEPVVGFWGMRFPGDKLCPAPSAASGSPGPAAQPPVAVKPATPALAVVPKPEPKIAATTPKVVELKAVERPSASAVHPVVATTIPAAVVQPQISQPPAPTNPLPSLEHLMRAAHPGEPAVSAVPPLTAAPLATEATRFPEAKVSAAAQLPTAPAKLAEDSTETLRQQAARLQEQLSSLLFAETTAPKNEPAQVPPVDAGGLAETTAKILEFVDPLPGPAVGSTALSVGKFPQAAMEAASPKIEIAPPAPSFSAPAKSILDVDEDIKIPAWLEPLARNTVAPVSTQELIEREKAKHAAALNTTHQVEELAAEPLPAPESEAPLDLRVPTFGSELPLDQPQFSSETSSPRSKAPVWLGLIAAGLFAAAGGAWYFKPQPNTNLSNAEALAPLTAHVASNTLQPQQLASSSSAKSLVLPGSSSQPPASQAGATPGRNSSVQPGASAPAAALVNANAKMDVVRSAAPAQPEPQPKKPSLGQVHFGAPTVNRKGAGANSSDPAPAISGSTENESNGDSLGSGILGGNAKQPAAPNVPLPVGGDVKTAELVSRVAPVYSTLAKSQHISGDVKIDALIDATGHVSTMKVVSGPTLLHQAAMDALHQWKYKPATLDGRAVPMHLTVTIQFRMQ